MKQFHWFRVLDDGHKPEPIDTACTQFWEKLETVGVGWKRGSSVFCGGA